MSDDIFGGELGDRILPIDINEEMQTSYIDYAMSVIVGRALPDVRDGMKPVHRRTSTQCMTPATARSVLM